MEVGPNIDGEPLPALSEPSEPGEIPVEESIEAAFASESDDAQVGAGHAPEPALVLLAAPALADFSRCKLAERLLLAVLSSAAEREPSAYLGVYRSK